MLARVRPGLEFLRSSGGERSPAANCSARPAGAGAGAAAGVATAGRAGRRHRLPARRAVLGPVAGRFEPHHWRDHPGVARTERCQPSRPSRVAPRMAGCSARGRRRKCFSKTPSCKRSALGHRLLRPPSRPLLTNYLREHGEKMRPCLEHLDAVSRTAVARLRGSRRRDPGRRTVPDRGRPLPAQEPGFPKGAACLFGAGVAMTSARAGHSRRPGSAGVLAPGAACRPGPAGTGRRPGGRPRCPSADGIRLAAYLGAVSFPAIGATG